MSNSQKIVAVMTLAAAFVGLSAFAEASTEASGRPQGFRPFNGLTLSPYVNLSYTYDSNVDGTKKAQGDSIFIVGPGLNVNWQHNDWEFSGNVWYDYHYYAKYNNVLGENSYGESASLKKSSSKNGEKGWTLMLGERYAFISQDDSIGKEDGRGIWRDRDTIDVNGVYEYRFTDRLHASINGAYDYLHYDNSDSKWAPLYGWNEWSVGGELGYAFTPWTDALLDAGYSRYTNDGSSGVKNYKNSSDSYTLQAGFGSHATRNITYRALLGASWFDYGEGHQTSGWTYSLSSRWKLARKWSLMALGSSYYQPSERDLGSAIKVYALSGGVSYMPTDRWTFTADLAWRHEQSIYTDDYLAGAENYDEDLLSGRLGANWLVNRYLSLFVRADYETLTCEDRSNYDYNRVRGTVGMQLHF